MSFWDPDTSSKLVFWLADLVEANAGFNTKSFWEAPSNDTTVGFRKEVTEGISVETFGSFLSFLVEVTDTDLDLLDAEAGFRLVR